MQFLSPSRLLRAAVLAGCLTLAAAPLPAARADEFVDRANQLYANIRPQRRSDTVLLPAVAGMDAPPASAATPDQAMLLPAGSSGWSAAEAWAKADNQQAVIRALDQVTRQEEADNAMAFGQPYGVDALAASSEGIALIQAGLYTELGDPPMLSAAKFEYLPALDRVASLVNVEATRLGAEGKLDEALDVLTDWAYFCRQMVDRAFYQESRWGMERMIAALDRIRDVVYTNTRLPDPAVTPQVITGVLDRLREDGYLRIERSRLPQGNRIAGEQAVARIFRPRGAPDPATFAGTMARLASTEHPLRLFSEAAKWDGLAAMSADQVDTSEQLQNLYNDWGARWDLSPFDRLMAVPTGYERMSRTRFASLAAAVPDLGELFSLRQVLDAQLIGTRNALGIVSFHLMHRSWPPAITAIRPAIVRDIGADPFNPAGRNVGGKPPLEYFVPIRDTKGRFGPRETPRPHEINVFTPQGGANFQARVGEDQFVLYSVGPNGKKEWADNATGIPVKDSIGDLLIWPPFISLYRTELQSRGTLK